LPSEPAVEERSRAVAIDADIDCGDIADLAQSAQPGQVFRLGALALAEDQQGLARWSDADGALQRSGGSLSST
jgi:hypothetical protein